MNDFFYKDIVKDPEFLELCKEQIPNLDIDSIMKLFVCEMKHNPRLSTIYEKVLRNMKSDRVTEILVSCLFTDPFDESLAEACLKCINKDEFFNRDKIASRNPLIRASSLGRLEVVKFLVEHGANVNCISDNLTTPIMYAFQEGFVDVVKYLYDQGAKIVVGKRKMIDYYHNSCGKSYTSLIEYLDEGLEKLRQQIKDYQEQIKDYQEEIENLKRISK